MASPWIWTRPSFVLSVLALSHGALAGEPNAAAPIAEMTFPLEQVATSAYEGPFHDVIERDWATGEDGKVRLPPSIRQGAITLGSASRHVVLMPALDGKGFSDPGASLYLEGMFTSNPELRRWRAVSGVLYAFSATPNGDKLTVQPYTGPFGILEAGAGGRDVKNPSLEMATLEGPRISIDLDDCVREGRGVKVPIGDFRATWGKVALDGVRVTLQVLRPGTGEPPKSPVFNLKIRESSPRRLAFSDRPQVIFRSPAENARVVPGQEVMVAAVMVDPSLDVIIRYLEDMTRKDGEAFRVPNGGGRWFQPYVALQPAVEVRDASGKRVAQGTMPFG
jgi:hypothetical protein